MLFKNISLFSWDDNTKYNIIDLRDIYLKAVRFIYESRGPQTMIKYNMYYCPYEATCEEKWDWRRLDVYRSSRRLLPTLNLGERRKRSMSTTTKFRIPFHQQGGFSSEYKSSRQSIESYQLTFNRTILLNHAACKLPTPFLSRILLAIT